jgi:hypothetical protein
MGREMALPMAREMALLMAPEMTLPMVVVKKVPSTRDLDHLLETVWSLVLGVMPETGIRLEYLG